MAFTNQNERKARPRLKAKLHEAGSLRDGSAKSPIEIAAAKLRAIALGTAEGEYLGSEVELVEKLGVARITIRQAARLIEREGLLRVRRGINGGYFASRPSVEMVESIVCGYLNTLGLDSRHGGLVATGLWVQVLREASKADRTAVRTIAEQLGRQINALGSEMTIEHIGRFEQEFRSEIFKLIDGDYVELLFRINAAFSRQQIGPVRPGSNVAANENFVRLWKKAKLLELDAISGGDELLAMIAALRSRELWTDRANRRQTHGANRPQTNSRQAV